MRNRASSPSRLAALLSLMAIAPSVHVGSTLAGQVRPPEPGERVRVQVGAMAVSQMGLPAMWEGNLMMVRDGALIGRDPFRGGMVIPMNQLLSLEVERSRSPVHTVVRATRAGLAFGGGMFLFLRVLCRSVCSESGNFWQAAGPAVAIGGTVGLLVAGQGPGKRWVTIQLPLAEPEGGSR